MADVLLVTRTVAVCACHRLGSIWVHWGDAKRVSNEPWQSIALERYHRSTSFPSQKSGRDDVVGVTSEPIPERGVVLTLVYFIYDPSNLVILQCFVSLYGNRFFVSNWNSSDLQ